MFGSICLGVDANFAFVVRRYQTAFGYHRVKLARVVVVLRRLGWGALHLRRELVVGNGVVRIDVHELAAPFFVSDAPIDGMLFVEVEPRPKPLTRLFAADKLALRSQQLPDKFKCIRFHNSFKQKASRLPANRSLFLRLPIGRSSRARNLTDRL